MKKSLFVIITILITIGFNGCSIYSPLPPSELNKKTKIGVVSMSGDYMNFHLIGTTAFNNELKKVNIKHWGISNFLKEITENKLNKKSNMTVVNLKYDITSLKEKAQSTTFTNDFAGYNPDKIENELKDLIKKYHLNYIVVIVPSQMVEFYGIELYKRQFLKSNKYSELQVLYSFKLYDGKTMDKITQFYIDGTTKIDNTIWDNGEKKVSKKDMQFLKNLAKKQITKNIEKPLLKMGLILN